MLRSYLRGVNYKKLQNVIKFMYQGEVNVAVEDVNNIIDVAQDLSTCVFLETNKRNDTMSDEPLHSNIQSDLFPPGGN